MLGNVIKNSGAKVADIDFLQSTKKITCILLPYYVLLVAFGDKKYQMLQKNGKLKIVQLITIGVESRM